MVMTSSEAPKLAAHLRRVAAAELDLQAPGTDPVEGPGTATGPGDHHQARGHRWGTGDGGVPGEFWRWTFWGKAQRFFFGFMIVIWWSIMIYGVGDFLGNF